MVSLVTSYPFKWNPAASAGAQTTASFTPTVGDIIVVKMVTEGTTIVGSAPTGTNGLVFTNRVTYNQSGRCWIAIWTAPVVNAGACTVSSGAASAQGARSTVVEHYTSAQLAASPAATSATYVTAGAPSATLTTVAANSVVSWADGDWGAVGGTITYRTTSGTPVQELGDQDTTGVNYCGYHAYQPAASAGSQTFGMTAPSNQQWAMAAIEIQDNASGSALTQSVSDDMGLTDARSGLPGPDWVYSCDVVIA